MKRIRKNSTTRIYHIIKSAALIRLYRYDDHGSESRIATADETLKAFDEDTIESVWDEENGVVKFSICRGYQFTAYANVGAARKDIREDSWTKFGIDDATLLARVPATPDAVQVAGLVEFKTASVDEFFLL